MVSSNGIRQKKSLGQVFLNETWPAEKVVEILKKESVLKVLEIGPGGGVLTRLMVSNGFHITAVEKDDRFAEQLIKSSEVWSESLPGSLAVINEDILKFDLEEWVHASGEKLAIVGNIPYNISTPIFKKILPLLDSLAVSVFMTQLEFAERLVGKPNSKSYGSLSVFIQMRSLPTLECLVEKGCFRPVPKVDSAIISLRPLEAILPAKELKWVETVCRTAFTQRRKKLLNAIKPFLKDQENESCPIDLARRPDAISPEEYVMLADFLKQ